VVAWLIIPRTRAQVKRDSLAVAFVRARVGATPRFCWHTRCRLDKDIESAGTVPGRRGADQRRAAATFQKYIIYFHG
jgi:hypothetical protein